MNTQTLSGQSPPQAKTSDFSFGGYGNRPGTLYESRKAAPGSFHAWKHLCSVSGLVAAWPYRWFRGPENRPLDEKVQAFLALLPVRQP